MNTRPTPETDREDVIITKGKPTHWVSQEFARRLERERDEARETIAAALKALPVGYLPAHTPESIPSRIEDLCKTIVETERELAEAHAEIKLLKTNLEISFRQTEQAVQDRADEHQILTEQRDNLELRMEAEIGAAQHANQQLDEIVCERDKLQSEVEQLKLQLTRTQGCVTISRNGYVQDLERQRDMLADALECIRDYRGRFGEDDPQGIATDALAAVKGGEQ